VDDRHYSYNTELPTKDTTSRVSNEDGELVGPVVQCFDDAQGTSFCCIGTENGNDGGVRKLKE